MRPVLKILFGALMVVVGIYSSLTYTAQLVEMVQAVIGPLLVLIGAFIIWLESDEWKISREESSEGDRSLQESLKSRASHQTDTAKYIDILDGNVQEVKEEINSLSNPDYEKLMRLEKKGKDRKTVKEFIERRID